MTNCITAYFSFCSVESVKHSNKGFQFGCFFFVVVFFFGAPMLLIAKCNSLIMMLNKCVFFSICCVKLVHSEAILVNYPQCEVRIPSE